LIPPAPRVELVVLEIFDHGIARIHRHLIEVPPWPALVAQIAYSYPPAILILPGLIIEI
jgi:hypothetical protein